jgi:hypothetical protein
MKKVRDYGRVLEQLHYLSKEIPAIRLERLGVVRVRENRYPFYALTLGIGATEVCLSGGIHGDEPAGVETVLEFLRRIQNNPSLLHRFRFTLFPCNNPFGYEHDTRRNGRGLDLNRQYAKAKPPAEVRMIKDFLGGKSFELSLEFHEDVDTDGYYLYELAADPKRLAGEEIIQRISERWPINLRAEIEGAPSRNGVINPHVAGDFLRKRISRRRQWPQAIWLYQNGTRHCVTSETPVTHPMPERVEIHLTALEVALENLSLSGIDGEPSRTKIPLEGEEQKPRKG